VEYVLVVFEVYEKTRPVSRSMRAWAVPMSEDNIWSSCVPVSPM